MTQLRLSPTGSFVPGLILVSEKYGGPASGQVANAKVSAQNPPPLALGGIRRICAHSAPECLPVSTELAPALQFIDTRQQWQKNQVPKKS